MRIFTFSVFLVVTSCATSNFNQDYYSWKSAPMGLSCINNIGHDSKTFKTAILHNVNNYSNCLEVRKNNEYSIYKCEKNGREVSAIFSRKKNVCEKVLRNEFGVISIDSKETFEHKGVRFRLFDKWMVDKSGDIGKNFWSYGYLRKATAKEVGKHLGEYRNAKIAKELFLIPTIDYKKALYMPGKKVTLKMGLSRGFDLFNIDGKEVYIINAVRGGLNPNFYDKQPKFTWNANKRVKEARMIKNQKVFEGMTLEAFRALLWAKRFKVNYYDSGREEQWVLGNDYFYFRNGILVNWQSFGY